MKTNAVKLEFGFGVGKDRLQLPISPAALATGLKQIKDQAVYLWGGYTLLQTEGGWKNEAGELVKEPGFTLVILVTDLYNLDLTCDRMITSIKNTLRQEAVAFTQTAVNFQIL